MSMPSQEKNSVWQKLNSPALPALSNHETTDVCIVGAGFSGLSAAYRLLESGRSVIVIDRDGLYSGQTALTSGHLSNVLDKGYFQLKKLHGNRGIQLAALSHSQAITEVERVAAKESIECEFTRTPGYLFLGPDDDESTLQREFEACHEAGLLGVEYLRNWHSPIFSTGPCLRFPHQARFHPMKYISGIARAIQLKGGKIYAHTEACSIEGGKSARVITNRGFHVVANTVIVATNVPFNDRFTLQNKMAPYRTYVIGLRLPIERLDLSLFWDTAYPYHYLRTCTDQYGTDILLLGGEDHRTGHEQAGIDRFHRLHSWARDRLGIESEIIYRWSGQLLKPHDGLAFIGQNPGDHENIFVVTGAWGSGLTHGALGAILLTDLITKTHNAWAELYAPSRVNLRCLGTFITENANTAASYADWLKVGDVESTDQIPPGEGAILRFGVQKIAAYKDHHQSVHFYSAVCPHLSGIVRWNEVEKTWDCPCHGSRFDRDGKVINGPALTGLKEIADNTLRGENAVSA